MKNESEELQKSEAGADELVSEAPPPPLTIIDNIENSLSEHIVKDFLCLRNRAAGKLMWRLLEIMEMKACIPACR